MECLGVPAAESDCYVCEHLGILGECLGVPRASLDALQETCTPRP